MRSGLELGKAVIQIRTFSILDVASDHILNVFCQYLLATIVRRVACRTVVLLDPFCYGRLRILSLLQLPHLLLHLLLAFTLDLVVLNLLIIILNFLK